MDRLSDKKKIKSNRGKLFDSKIQSKVTKLHEHPQKNGKKVIQGGTVRKTYHR